MWVTFVLRCGQQGILLVGDVGHVYIAWVESTDQLKCAKLWIPTTVVSSYRMMNPHLPVLIRVQQCVHGFVGDEVFSTLQPLYHR